MIIPSRTPLDASMGIILATHLHFFRVMDGVCVIVHWSMLIGRCSLVDVHWSQRIFFVYLTTGLLKDGSFGDGDGWCGKSKYCRRAGSGGRQRSGSSFQLWSPRLKQRDERKRVLKMSLAKLRRIEDAESCLRRSVLLNNTLRRLQREARDEKASAMERLQQQWPETLDSRLEHPAAPVRLDPAARSLLSADELPGAGAGAGEEAPERPAPIKRRRSSEDDEAGALGFSELYLPAPTPRLISSLDADDDVVDVVSEDALDAWSCKRAKTEAPGRPALRPCNSLPAAPAQQYSTAGQSAAPTLVSGYASASGAASQTYSCGQSSLFGELQSVVFHSLITSLES